MNQQFKVSKTTFIIIWLAMFIACGVYYIVPNFIIECEGIADHGLDDGGPIEHIHTPYVSDAPGLDKMPYIFGLISIVQTVLGFGFLMTTSRVIEGRSAQQYLAYAKIRFIITLALFEAIPIYGIVQSLMGYPVYHRHFIITGAVLILIAGIFMVKIFNRYESLRESESGGMPVDLFE